MSPEYIIVGMFLVLVIGALVGAWIHQHDEAAYRKALSPEETNKRVAKAIKEHRSVIDGRPLDRD